MPFAEVPLIKPMVPKHQACINVRAHSKNKLNWKYHLQRVTGHAANFGYRCSDPLETSCDVDSFVVFVSVLSCERRYHDKKLCEDFVMRSIVVMMCELCSS